jgi:hypothetical protein
MGMEVDTNAEVSMLGQLSTALAVAGVNSTVRSELPALAINTTTPGVHLWAYISASGRRYACYLDSLHEYPTNHPACAAREIATYAKTLLP